ncbi:MAG: RNA degradosome polyphosphate kinase, partial [Spirochaetes bacterium]|nr:RNA degradosome polyphosphate kinase [Spirochaetota bacterium]
MEISHFFNRELSWVEFNYRVLEEALDKNIPLLERLKFLAIFSNNLDEFVMVRIAGLVSQVKSGYTLKIPPGFTPEKSLNKLQKRINQLVE